MPAVLVSTLTDEGKTTCGPYSLLAPFYVAGKEYYAFMLECRNSSNTAQNLIKHKKCVINFMDDERKTFKEMVRLGWPGDTPAEKMKDFAFHLENGLRKAEDPKGTYPKVISEALQAVECTWVDTLDGAQDDGPLPEGADHYELEKYHDFNGGRRISRRFRWITATGIPRISGTTSTEDCCRSSFRSGRPPSSPSAMRRTACRQTCSSQTLPWRNWSRSRASSCRPS